MSIYRRAIKALLREGVLSRKHSIIVTCGGSYDAETLARFDFREVLVTNLDQLGDCAPYRWQRADAENLPFPDGSFDWAIVHAGLHHCASPHRALAEMIRVARKGVIAIEARDSWAVRLAVRLGLTSDYEIEAVVIDGGAGGYRNGPIPNYVYRWTERDVVKAAESARPDRVNAVRFFYGLRLPTQRLSMSSAGKRLALKLIGMAARLFVRLAPKQGNEFAFAILDTGQDKPWIRRTAVAELSPSYRLGFDPSRYDREAA